MVKTQKGEKKQTMVNIKEIPKEEPRIDLSELPQTNVLIAVEEHFVNATEDKTGGLVITFRQKDNQQFAQKYGKVSGRKLVEAMEKLKLNDTEDLQKSFYEYKMTPMRSGYPRYIPLKKIEA